MPLATGGIQPFDWVVVGLYFVGVIGMGVYFARQQRSTNEYFLGSRSMASWVVGLSMIATLLSTITYLAIPGEMIKHGPAYLLHLLALAPIFFIVGYLFVPFFMRLPITSAYEYLEARFGSETRTLGALFFVLIRIIWMSVVVYTASGALAKMTELPLWIVIVSVGVFTTFYAAFGGIRAVIWTDVIQFIILFGGAVFTVGYVTWTMGGFSSWVRVAIENTRLDSPVWSSDPTTRLSVIGIIINTIAWFVCTYGSDQVVVQRYLSTRDAPAAKRSFLVCIIGDAALAIVLGAVGLALLAFFTQHGDLLTGEFKDGMVDQADHVFPYFIANQLPVGLTGLVIAALFAAAMSSLDSGVNSLSAVITVDFYNRFRRAKQSDATSLGFAKTLGLGLGLTATGLAFLVGNIEGNIVEITNKSTSCTVGPLFGLFALGMFSRRCNQMGALTGAVAGFIAGLLVTFSGQWFDYNISFMWIIVTSVIVMAVVALVVSLFGPRPSASQIQFTRRSVMSGPPPVM
ncbi:MAG: sodium/solute symporter [Phycisphaerae bacterium]|nr:sodium/solute symporter [Phycisphaerae bacterium]